MLKRIDSIYPYEFFIGGIEWNISGLGKGLRPKVFLLTVRDDDVFEFLRLDGEVILLFDKVVFRFEVRFCLLDFFLFDGSMVERLDVFLERFFRETATIES
jgi:hypothetical protein